MAAKRRPTAAARSGVLPRASVPKPRVSTSWLPSARSLAVAGALLIAGMGAYMAARETAVFSIQEIEVEGAPPELAARIRAKLAPLAGTSLVSFEADAGDRRLVGLPAVASASYDRDFPHTLRVTVQAERAAAVLRRGRDAWLVSVSVRVLATLSRPYPRLPRIWLSRDADIEVGATLDGNVGVAVAALGSVRRARLPVRIRSVRAAEKELALVLADGTDVLLGDTSVLPLKLAVLRRILPLAGGAGYIDVSVPERAVAGLAGVGQP